MMKLAIATYVDHPALTADDTLLGAALTERGVDWTALPWSDPDVDWSYFDAVLIRSTWDYHQRPADFLQWISSLQASNIFVWNSPETIRRNIHKGYLRELEDKGVVVVPTFWIRQGEDGIDLRRLADERGWTDIVAKPAISAGGRDIIRWSADDPEVPNIALIELAANSDVLVQPFLEAVVEGELSFIFFEGAFSHAVRKTPRAGDYRVQAKFGGAVDRIDPSPEFIDRARRVAGIHGNHLYCRVDGISVDDQLLVMEVELIEPDLFFHVAPDATVTFASSIERRLSQVRRSDARRDFPDGR